MMKSISASVSKVLIEDWTALIEAGWGAIKDTRFGGLWGQEAIYTL